mgnify:CR=1 FL=1
MIKLLNKLKNLYYYWKVKRGITDQAWKKLKETEISERWVTKRILDGQQGRRAELVDLQAAISELKAYLEFLTKI